MRSEPTPRVLLIAPSSHYLLRSLPRLFAAAGVDLLVAAPLGCVVFSSRHIRSHLSYDASPDKVINCLEQLVTEHRPDRVFVLEETLLRAIAEADDQRCSNLKSHFEHLKQFPIERTAFHSWSVACAIPVPQGKVVSDLEGALQTLNTWPRIYLKRNHTTGGNGVFHLKGPDEIRELWPRLHDAEPVLIQEELTGKVGVCEMVCSHGKVLAWNSSQKWQTSGKCGPSVARKIFVPSNMETLAHAIAAATGFDGLCGFDWVIDERDGQAKMIEFHPRPPSGYGIGRWAGVAFDQAIAGMLGRSEVTLQRPDPSCFKVKSVCCYFPDHPLYCWKTRDWNGLRHWLPWSSSRSWAMLPWDDPALLLHMLTSWFRRQCR